jgi:tetratricopeptide (TPR) repeat protein
MLAALTCAAALLAMADRRESPRLLSFPGRVAGFSTALLLVVVAFVGLVGASALAASGSAFDEGRYGEAHSQARKAARWWRWSPDPWQQLGDIEAAQGDTAAARASYRKAITKSRGDWQLWYDLSTVSNGAEEERALAEAKRLNRYATTDFDEAGNVPR